MKISIRFFSALLTSALLLVFFAGCNKKEEPVSNTPSIKFISMTPATATKNVDEIKITIEYTDGDGDLGENTPDVKNLFCTDSRNDVTYEYRIPQLAPTGSNIIITGQQVFNLPPQGFADDSHTTETTTYSIYVVDRAGNQSNTVQTNVLTINQ